MKQSFSLVEAAKFLKQDPKTVRSWIKKGQLQARKTAANQYAISRIDLNRFYNKHKNNLG